MHTDLTATSLDLSYDGSQSPGSGGSLSQQARNKRMRTSFKHHQLRTMKSYFAINQNPDAKDLKQLSQKTGLSKRVLQVREITTKIYIFDLRANHWLFILVDLGLVSECAGKMATQRHASRRWQQSNWHVRIWFTYTIDFSWRSAQCTVHVEQ